MIEMRRMIREHFSRCNENRRSNPGPSSIISTRTIVRAFLVPVMLILLLPVLIGLFLPGHASGAGSLRAGTIVSAKATSTNTLTIPNVNVPSDASNSILVVVAAAEHNIEDVYYLPSTVTWGTDALSKVEDHYVVDSEIGSVWSASAAMWILRRPTVNQTKDVTITFNGTPMRCSGSAFIIEDVADADAEATAEHDDQDTSPTNTVITTVSADAFILDFFVSGGIITIEPNQSGQTERIEYAGDSHYHGVSDKQGPSTPGDTTLGWTSDSNNRQCVVVAAFSSPTYVYSCVCTNAYWGSPGIRGSP